MNNSGTPIRNDSVRFGDRARLARTAANLRSFFTGEAPDSAFAVSELRSDKSTVLAKAKPNLLGGARFRLHSNARTLAYETVRFFSARWNCLRLIVWPQWSRCGFRRNQFRQHEDGA
jgi:hypothetical protein